MARTGAARWQRILTASTSWPLLPPVDLIKFGDQYWVVDGHNRVAAALYNGQVRDRRNVVESAHAGCARRADPQPEIAPYLAGTASTCATAGAAGQRRTPRTHDPGRAGRRRAEIRPRDIDPEAHASTCRRRPASRTPSRPLRLLAISDEKSPTLDFERNRAQLGPIDAVLGCGDLEPDYLAFLADAFNAPLLYVRGNHDRDAGWTIGSERIPDAARRSLRASAASPSPACRGRARTAAAPSATAPRPGGRRRRPCAKATRRQRPDIILSHVPPRGLGDTAGG